MRRILRTLKWLAIVVVVAAVGLGAYVGMYWDRTWDVPEPDLHASTDPAVIARGEYIVYGPGHCLVCHTGSVEEFERFVDTGMPPALAGGADGAYSAQGRGHVDLVHAAEHHAASWQRVLEVPGPRHLRCALQERRTALSGIADAVGGPRQDDAGGHRRDLRVPAHRAAVRPARARRSTG